ncbi:hypothetical protein QFZ35_001915 [Arthrobacter ulcerisalmonis]|uniref:hypothetical protein n=1 Tax=Arthrobacter sp. B1I2 TaxID=3042263 RepID=UPI002780DFB7|nr:MULTISPECIES: hypothetical protein [Arthrobacter]MDQ0663417.1 hypothetical protein [Arthrobacter ulcerisalmonis]MDQ0731307.1 hypothetical protein [Arthrobacter sp. B1I2]
MSPSDRKDAHEGSRCKNDERILHLTATGELHGYRREEPGRVTASSQAQVRSAAGFLVLAVVFAAVAVFFILLVTGLTSRGEDPMWSSLFLTLAGASGALYALRRARVASTARRLRAERGIPEPSARQPDCDQDQHGQA